MTARRARAARHVRRHPRRTGVTVLVAALVMVVLAGLGPASAARLAITSAPLTTASAAPCTAGTIAGRAGTVTNGSSTQVVLSAVPAACQGRPVVVRVYAADGTPLATSDTSATLTATDTTTVTVPAFAAANAAGVAVTVSTWALGTVWSGTQTTPAGPVTPGPGTSFDQTTWTQVSTSGTQACVTVQVSGTAGTVWRVDLHTDQRPFNGVTTGSGFQVHSPWWGQKLTADPVNGVLSIGGGPGREARTAGETITVTICNYNLPAPVYDPTLTYRQSTAAPYGNEGYTCMETTVGVTGTPQFYAGWKAEVDVQPLVDFLAARGRTASAANATTQGNRVLTYLGGTRVRVAPSAWDTSGVRDDTTQTFLVCLQP
jgi:hypothetical protein